MKIDFQLRITAQQRQARCYCHGSWEQETMGPDHVVTHGHMSEGRLEWNGICLPGCKGMWPFAHHPGRTRCLPFTHHTSDVGPESSEWWSESVSLSLCVSCFANTDIMQLTAPLPQQSRCSHSTVSDGINHPVLIGNVKYHLNSNQAANAKNLPVIESRRGCDYPETSTNNWWKIRAQ